MANVTKHQICPLDESLGGFCIAGNARMSDQAMVIQVTGANADEVERTKNGFVLGKPLGELDIEVCAPVGGVPRRH